MTYIGHRVSRNFTIYRPVTDYLGGALLFVIVTIWGLAEYPVQTVVIAGLIVWAQIAWVKRQRRRREW